MDSELKACPNTFGKCDHRQAPVVTFLDFDARNAPLRHVICHSCGQRGPVADTEAKAILAWNTRAPDAKAETVAEIVAMVPVAWRYERPSRDKKINVEERVGFYQWPDWMKSGWTETPLYSLPGERG